jgi:hypothetical protein
MKEQQKMKRSYLIIGLVILFILLIWGFIGSSKTSEIGNTCDFGLGKNGDLLCWKWHQNIVGDITEIVNPIFNN